MSEEKFYFQSEAAELLRMMISSVYSNRDIFLRELISNASDALDKRRIECLKDSELAENTKPEILITSNTEKKILSVSDNGIGMSRDDLITYLGTIAKSGTKEFLKAAKNENTDSELIGQFGVGFYSVFMVADKVEVLTRKLGSGETYKFISDGDGSYTIEDADQRSECGTTVTLYLRHNDNPEDGFKDYSNEWVIREIIGKYSDFISWPVVFKDNVVNSQKAIWQRPDSEIKEEEYNEFYKHLTHDWRDPLMHIKLNAEGATNFKALLFIPSEAPRDIFRNRESEGVSLYINRVFIMNDCKDLIPEYMNFIKGVIDSEDLPLNISREILQDEPVTRVIKRSTQRKVLVELKKLLSSDREKYIKFWQSFGYLLKRGIAVDSEYAKNILEISLFRTTHDDGWTTLAEYESRMQPDQDVIYCLLGGDNISALKASPKLEAFREKNLEVLLMTDTIDDFILSGISFTLPEGMKKLVNIASDDVSPYSESEKKDNEEKLKSLDADFNALKEKALEILGDKLENVKPSLNLTSSPACIRDPIGGMSVQMEYSFRAMGQNPPVQKRILELNANHPVVKKLLEMSGANDEKVSDVLKTLYDQSMILEGVPPDDPADFVKRIDDLMTLALVK